eukprot:scaffold1.g5844.t1
MTDSLLAHGLKSRQESRETPYLTRADYKSVLMIKQDGALPIARRPATISLARTWRGGAGAGLRRQQAAQRAGVPARQFSDKLLKQFKVVYSPAGDPILTRWAARMPEVGGPRHLVVIALEDLLELLEKEKTASGYPGVKKMFNKLYNLYPTEVMDTSGRAETWFGLEGFDREGIEIYLKECRVRADLRPLLPSEQPAPHPIVIHRAFEQMQADLLDLGAGRDEYFRYVLVAVELFTRHAWLFPLPTKEGVLVARAMYMLWMDTQRPARFQTDNGTEFCNDLLEALCSLCGVKHITSSVGNPQSQGATERLNRTLKDRLRALLIDAPTHSWPYQLMQVQKIINNEPCEALGGRMPRTMALFGAPEPAAGLPSAAAISELLQFERKTHACVETCYDRASRALPVRARLCRPRLSPAEVNGRSQAEPRPQPAQQEVAKRCSRGCRRCCALCAQVLGGVSDPSLRSKDIMWHRMEGKMLVPMKWMQRQSVDDIIAWVDAYDAGPEEVLRKYRAMDAEVVYSAELNCWPFSHWGNRERANKTCERYPPTPRSRQPRYINTGVIVGRAGTMVRLVKTLNNLLTYHRKDFQQLDYYSEITKNMFMAEQDVEPNVMGGRCKMPFYNLNGSMWYDVAHARLPESAAVYAFDGTALPFRTICPGVVM